LVFIDGSMSPKERRGAKKGNQHAAKGRAGHPQEETIPSSDAAALSLGEVSPFDAATHGPDMAHETGN
jgi:hypothetical protein